MLKLKTYQFWFVTGSQHLYGPETLKEVGAHSKEMAAGLNHAGDISFEIVFKPVLTTPEEILTLCREANIDPSCAGIITWMHTFSPAKMWIAGLKELHKPLLHFHTQFNRDIPWDEIDMDFMNLNQAAHGDREYGFIGARMNISRKVVVGFWKDTAIQQLIGQWQRTAVGYTEGRQLKVARFGDNMRQVAVTEGDKVEAQIKLGWTVNGYGVGDLVAHINRVNESDLNELLDEYLSLYDISEVARTTPAIWNAIKEQARYELGMKRFLTEGGYTAFTTTFEDLHGLKQLPGLAVQRLMAQGYGFGGEGDWKTAALVRIMKIMANGKRTSFMEDYTYHMEAGNEMVLGAHMLEICPSIAATKPRIEVHPLSIGGKSDPARLVFDGASGAAINASVIDLGQRFRLLLNSVEAIQPEQAMPKLPVARVLWKPQPSLNASAEAWILAGGAHHTCYSNEVTAEQMIDWAEMVGIEAVLIDEETKPLRFKDELKWNHMYWQSRS